MITAVIVLGFLASLFGICLFRERKAKLALQQRLSVVESTLTATAIGLDHAKQRISGLEYQREQELTQEQIDYKDQLQAQYAVLFQKIESDLKKDLQEVKDSSKEAVKAAEKKFDDKLKSEYDKACEQIKFNEIEYKKTITKKRKEYSRKNGKNAKPKRIWRYINEE